MVDSSDIAIEVTFVVLVITAYIFIIGKFFKNVEKVTNSEPVTLGFPSYIFYLFFLVIIIFGLFMLYQRSREKSIKD